MPRRTKIVATLGPATDAPGVLESMVQAGLNVARLNMSHDSHERHRKRVERVRTVAKAMRHPLGVLIDLQGPKIRIGRFAKGGVELSVGDRFRIDLDCPLDSGDQHRVGCTYGGLADDLMAGDRLLLDDGAVELKVEGIDGRSVDCSVQIGGLLADSKGINKRGGGLSAPALTDKDKADIEFAASVEADYLAVSFVRGAEDIHLARQLFRAAGGKGGIVAKIERAEALENAAEIIKASEVIMVARGDLGVEIGDAELPAVQKRLISDARTNDCVVITATQMMQSMIASPIPTRAEVFDVANAVLDGTDAVMLSAESSIGKHPARVVAALDRICAESENYRRKSGHRLDTRFGRVDEAIAMSAMYAANHLGVKAVAALTESGATVKWMSRLNTGIPIYALTRFVHTRRKVTLYRGVYPINFDVATKNIHEVNREVIEELLRQGTVIEGDLVIITKGDRGGVEGQTNIMKIMRVGEHRLLADD
ncbi:MAG: pyruvate kinase [Thiohalocapsa sp.]|jgi:pyruvate kinase